MKNFKIVMILVAAVAMFCSCSKEGPTATFTEKNTTLTYDLYTADQLLLEFDGNITAEAGIKTLKVTRTTMDSTDAVKGAVIEFTFEKDPEGETAFPFTIADTLFKAQLEKGYKVVYDVEVADKKDQTLVTPVQYTINIIDNTPATTALQSNWSETIYLTHQNETSWAEINGVRVDQYQNTTIGVKVGVNTSTDCKFSTTSNCEGFVFVDNTDYTTVEELEAAYTSGTVVTESSVAFDYHAKGFAPKNFISKVDNDYVLVKIVSADNSPNSHDNIAANVLGFQYKKGETPAPAK
ncbi:MAG: hypothetical protein IK025_04860 [Bacteroidales bacterium]|nr:hypothetical protein [Bacteroidales bacterium]